MTQEFCHHLDKYATLFRAADDAYHNCVELMDQVLQGSFKPDLLIQLNSTLNEWEKQTRILRSSFFSLQDKGNVLLPREGQNPNPVCGHCGQEVPRLEFPEFVVAEDGTINFRGEQLMPPEPIPV